MTPGAGAETPRDKTRRLTQAPVIDAVITHEKKRIKRRRARTTPNRPKGCGLARHVRYAVHLDVRVGGAVLPMWLFLALAVFPPWGWAALVVAAWFTAPGTEVVSE